LVKTSVKLDWKVDAALSGVHAACVVATGARCTDPQTEQLLSGPTTDINGRLVLASIDVIKFWNSYAEREIAGDHRELAVAGALIEAGCSELQLEQTATFVRHRLSDARLAFAQRHPKLEQQLPLRMKPLRERWETVGPGLLREVERQVWQNSPPADWWPPSIDVFALQPILGGAGGFDSDYDQIWIEAVLTDPNPQIPEVLRVVWLITSLAIETHIRSRTGQRVLSRAWKLVSVPLVLSAAAQLEFFPAQKLPIGLALQTWSAGDEHVVAKLQQWWQRYDGSDTPLPVALRQLDADLKN